MRIAANQPGKVDAATIRPMGRADVPAALAILQESPEASAWGAETVLGFCLKGKAWVAEAHSAVAGVLIGRIALEEFEILNMAVGKAFRRRGIATRLLTAALGEARREGALQAYLEVRASNQAAIALYGRIGFRVHGCRPQYYTGPTEDAVLMVFP